MIKKMLLLVFSLTSLLQAAEVDVYLLGGQSNMQGIGKLKNLPLADKPELKNVFFFQGGKFEVYEINKTKTSARKGEFGPELGFSKLMTESTPDKSIYLIKYHASGQPLHHGWNGNKWVGGKPAKGRRNFYPGTKQGDPNTGNLYATMTKKYKAGIKSLTDAGHTPVVKGFLWMQGEQDSKNEVSAGSYDVSLKRLITRMKQDLGLEKLPFVFGQVLPAEKSLPRFTHRKLIREKMAAADMGSGLPSAIPLCSMLSTDTFPLLPDTVHYNARGQLMLGESMAKEILTLQNTATTMKLWNDQVPGFPADYEHQPYKQIDPERISETSQPFMSIFPARGKPNKKALIILPGGGYRILADKKEGDAVAAYYSAHGFTCFVVRYRVTRGNHDGYKFPGPLLDARQSIRMVKSMAGKYGYSADEVGVIGFSAGGHLASMCATRFDDTFPGEKQEGNVRPKFAALIYPVASMIAPSSHRGSKAALFGKSPSEKDLIAASPERRVRKGFPPLFIAHNEFDPVDAKLSVALKDAYTVAGVPCELHLFSGKAHGFGMGRTGETVKENPGIVWPKLLLDYTNQ